MANADLADEYEDPEPQTEYQVRRDLWHASRRNARLHGGISKYWRHGTPSLNTEDDCDLQILEQVQK